MPEPTAEMNDETLVHTLIQAAMQAGISNSGLCFDPMGGINHERMRQWMKLSRGSNFFVVKSKD